MNTHFDTLKQHKADNNPADFNKVLNQFLPGLERYIRHRLKTAEAKGLLPVNFYAPADVLAEVYLRIYQIFDRINDARTLKIRMFQIADEIIRSYIEKENRIKQKVPVSSILAEELKLLEEKITANADGEPVLIEELDDMSYHQDEYKPKVFLFDKEAQDAYARALGLKPEDFLDKTYRSIFGSVYGQLPETIRQILDLVAIGGLTPEETAGVLGISAGEVNNVLEGIKIKLNNQR